MDKPNSVASSVRGMTRADLEMVLNWRNHADVRRYMYTQHEISLAEHERWFERAVQNPKKHLLIFEQNTVPLGFVNFNENEDGGVADWGFYIAPGAAKGTGRALGCAALSHAFEILKLHKICGQALAYNQRSIQFHQRLGFAQEGTLRDQHFDGQQYHHIVCFGLLATEWPPTPLT